jgi:hypothetical protein
VPKSVDAQVTETVKEAFAKVPEALEGACCLEPLSSGTVVVLEAHCGHTYYNRQTSPPRR